MMMMMNIHRSSLQAYFCFVIGILPSTTSNSSSYVS